MYDVNVYPDSYVICNETYGYDYFSLSFLDVAAKLTDDEEYEIAARMAKAFKDYMEERMAKTFKDHMEYEKHADDVMEANFGGE